MVEPLSDDADGEIGHVGEVRQAELARCVLLTEDNVLLRAMHRPPRPDAAFQRAADALTELGVAATHLVEDADRAQIGRGLKHRDDLAVPQGGERIGAAAAPRGLLRCRPVWGLLDPVGGRGAEPGLGAGDGRGVGLSVSHVKPYLTVGDMAARQGWGPHWHEDLRSWPSPLRPPIGIRPYRDDADAATVTPVGLRPPSVTAAAFLSHPDCRQFSC